MELGWNSCFCQDLDVREASSLHLKMTMVEAEALQWCIVLGGLDCLEFMMAALGFDYSVKIEIMNVLCKMITHTTTCYVVSWL